MDLFDKEGVIERFPESEVKRILDEVVAMMR